MDAERVDEIQSDLEEREGEETDDVVEDDLKEVKKGSLKKKYKKLIQEIIVENGNRRKLKKVKKEVVTRSAEFDREENPDARGDKFEKYLPKLHDIVLIGKYLTMM